MDIEYRSLLDLARTYFDAAYAMDAAKFATIFHPSASVTKVDDTGQVVVTPIETWLSVVRTLPSPQQRGDAREDAIASLHIAHDLALVQLTLRIAPRRFTDLLSCLKIDGAWKVVQKVMTSTP